MVRFRLACVLQTALHYSSKAFKVWICIALFAAVIFGTLESMFAQTYSPTYTTPYPNNQSTGQLAIRQEIARLEIQVARGSEILPINQVPQIRKGDVLKVRLLDEAVSGIKIDQTQWDWTLVVAYANPLVNHSKQETAAEEVRFRKTGWYKTYSFTVPFDSQPVFFLSPRGNFRGQVMKAMSKNYGELQKIGEKMVEISGAYAQINTFLNELQFVINQSQYGYNPSYNQYGYNNQYGNQYGTGNQYGYGNQLNYGNQYNYGNQPGYNNAYGYNSQYTYNQNPFWLDKAVEHLARSFNIQMPDCWRAANFTGGNSAYNQSYQYNNYSNSYGTSGSTYGGSYGSPISNGNYGGYPSNSYGASGFNMTDFVARSQCVAKTVRLEDFDVSITKMWQQGGVFFAAELQKKYPQLAYYINIAAAAIEFIVKVFQKSPLRIVPTMITATDSANAYQNVYQPPAGATYVGAVSSVGQSYQPTGGGGSPPLTSSRISVFSSQQPNDQGFLTAYPIVVQKWQPSANLPVTSIYPPVLADSCLHPGINLLKSTSLNEDSDSYTRDFKLVMTSTNGYRKEYPLKKNSGMNGWELNLTPQDLAQIPKINMVLEGQIAGLRGFDEVTSPKFKIPVAGGAKWELTPESQQAFFVGGRHRIALKNAAGDCRCVQSVTYKPSFGGQFEFVAGAKENGLQLTPEGSEVWFDIETSNFQPGPGTLEVRNNGSEPSIINLRLYSQIPRLTDITAAYGDREVKITGERLDQLQYAVIGGYRATVQPSNFPADPLNPQITSKLLIFDDPQAKINSKSVSLNLGLEDNRQYPYPQAFNILPARPEIKAGMTREIEAVSDATLLIENKSSGEDNPIHHQLGTRKVSVFPITTRAISLNLENIVSDYEFKNENIKIETRIEKSQTPTGDYLKTEFEVLDWNHLRLRFYLFGDIHTQLGGRRVQFRIRDRERGDSDWYTVKQTFVRTPEIAQIKCTDEMQGMCEMKGEGMEYVSQVSVDDGKTWYPGVSASLDAQPTADGLTAVMIPLLVNKKFLRIRLRDFQDETGFTADNYAFSNTVKNNFAARKTPADKKSGSVNAVPVNEPVNASAPQSVSAPVNSVTAKPAPGSAPTQPAHPPANSLPGAVPNLKNSTPAVTNKGALQILDDVV